MFPTSSLIVTGGARGIGLACATAGARAGYAVAILFRGENTPAERAIDTIKASGGTAMSIKADVGRADEVASAFSVIDNSLPPVAGLINNAGMVGPRGDLLDLTDEDVEAIFRVNFFGALRCTREAVRRMAKRNGGIGGSITMISSQAAVFGGVHIPAYAASKAALNAFTVGFARDAAKDGIRVNAISPGIIATRQNDDWSDEHRAHVVASLPMGRMGTPDEIANVAIWLASDAASYVNGAIIPVHGAR